MIEIYCTTNNTCHFRMKKNIAVFFAPKLGFKLNYVNTLYISKDEINTFYLSFVLPLGSPLKVSNF